MAFRIVLRGNPDFGDHGREVERAVAKALYLEANDAFNESQIEVPVDLGVLQSSGHVTLPEWAGHQVTISIVYGGASANYAVYVHEDLEARHDPPTKAKYLEDPVSRASMTMAARLGERVRSYLGA